MFGFSPLLKVKQFSYVFVCIFPIALSKGCYRYFTKPTSVLRGSHRDSFPCISSLRAENQSCGRSECQWELDRCALCVLQSCIISSQATPGWVQSINSLLQPLMLGVVFRSKNSMSSSKIFCCHSNAMGNVSCCEELSTCTYTTLWRCIIVKCLLTWGIMKHLFYYRMEFGSFCIDGNQCIVT